MQTPESSKLVTDTQKLMLLLFAALSFCAIVQSQPLRSANDRSRWCTVWSLVHRNTYVIDEIDADPNWTTIDKVRHEDHLYSSKPPLFSTMVAGLYWVQRQVFGYSMYRRPTQVIPGLLVVVNLLPFLVGLTLFTRAVNRYSSKATTRILLPAIAAFATLLTPFQTTLNNHSVAASCLMICLCLVLPILCKDPTTEQKTTSRSGLRFAVVGFFAAMTCTAELPAALFGVTIFLLLAKADFGRTLKFFVPAALVPLIAFFVTNWIATGGWKPFYMYYGTEKYRYWVDGVPSYWIEPQGLDRNTESTASYLFHCLIGHHGVLSLTPIFALSIIGWLMALRPNTQSIATRLRPIILPGAILSVCILCFYLTRTQNYNYGGNSIALRWMLWLIPFWLFALIPAIDWFCERKWFRPLTLVLMSVSIYSVGTGIGNAWSHPWLFKVLHKHGLIDYSRPNQPLPHPQKTWLGSLPNESGDWCEFESHGLATNPEASSIRLDWQDATPDDDVGTLKISRGSATDEVNVLISNFNAGTQPQEFLRKANGPIAAFLSGTYKSRDYQPGVFRYVRLPVRTNAFRCQRAATQTIRVNASGDRFTHRCDVWLTSELPFGVAKVEFTVTKVKDSAIVQKETWFATKTSGFYPPPELPETLNDG